MACVGRLAKSGGRQEGAALALRVEPPHGNPQHA